MFLACCSLTISGTVYALNLILRDAYWGFRTDKKYIKRQSIDYLLISILGLVLLVWTLHTELNENAQEFINKMLYDNKNTLLLSFGGLICCIICTITGFIKSLYDRKKLKAEEEENKEE